MGAVLADEPFSVGFTGTRDNLTNFQEKRLLELLVFLRKQGADTFHHGDCIGADAIAHDLAVRSGFDSVVVHPPTDSRYRAHCSNCPPKGITFRGPAPYLTRNHHIVVESTVMIACPKSEEIQRSGTWSTVRYARQQDRYLYVLYPFHVIAEQDPWGWIPADLYAPNWKHPLDRRD